MKSMVRVVWLAVTWATLAACSSNEDTGTGASGDVILDGGGEAASPPNGKALCPAGVCNYQTNEGCGANMTCAPSASDGKTPACYPAGSKPVGGSCTSWTDCEPGAVCAPNVCRKLCCGKDWTGCPANQHCIAKFEVQIPDAGIVDSKAYVCYPVNNCDALVPSSCSSIQPGTVCLLADETGATACLAEGKGTAGQACPCKGGFACLGNECRRLCRAVAGGGDPACPAAEGACVHFTRDPDGVGECTP